MSLFSLDRPCLRSSLMLAVFCCRRCQSRLPMVISQPRALCLLRFGDCSSHVELWSAQNLKRLPLAFSGGSPCSYIVLLSSLSPRCSRLMTRKRRPIRQDIKSPWHTATINTAEPPNDQAYRKKIHQRFQGYVPARRPSRFVFFQSLPTAVVDLAQFQPPSSPGHCHKLHSRASSRRHYLGLDQHALFEHEDQWLAIQILLLQAKCREQ